MRKLALIISFLSLATLSHGANIPDTNYDKMKTLYEQANQIPTLNDFDSYGQATDHPLHCVGYSAGSPEDYTSHPLVAQRKVAEATSGHGPLVPAEQAKFETKLVATTSSVGTVAVMSKPEYWEGVTNKTTAKDLVVTLNEKMGGQFIYTDTEFRKSGEFLAFKGVQKSDNEDPLNTYGYCYRSHREKWVALADVKIPQGDGYNVGGGWAFNDDKVTAEKDALDYCSGETGGRTCTVKSVQNGCVVSAYDEDRNFYQFASSGTTNSLNLAIAGVLSQCGGRCTEYQEACSDGWNGTPGAAR